MKIFQVVVFCKEESCPHPDRCDLPEAARKEPTTLTAWKTPHENFFGVVWTEYGQTGTSSFTIPRECCSIIEDDEFERGNGK